MKARCTGPHHPPLRRAPGCLQEYPKQAFSWAAFASRPSGERSMQNSHPQPEPVPQQGYYPKAFSWAALASRQSGARSMQNSNPQPMPVPQQEYPKQA